VTLKGGTHVPFSPPFDYFDDVFLPALEAMGVYVAARLDSAGFYPHGGGVAHIESEGASALAPLSLATRGPCERIELRAVIANLREDIAHRELRAAREELAKAGYHGVHHSISRLRSPAPGTVLFVLAEAAHSVAGFTSLGRRGKRAETVGIEAAREAAVYLDSEAAVDRHLADQLVLYMALARGRSVLTTEQVTSHLLTNIQVVSRFLDVQFEVEGELGAPGTIAVEGVGFSS